MTVFHAGLLTALIVVAANAAAWAIQRRTRNAAIVDAVWAWTLGALALFCAAIGSAPLELRLLLGVMGGAWGLRLGWHVWQRERGQAERWRYASLRRGLPPVRAERRLFRLFQYRSPCMWLLTVTAFLPIVYRPELPAAGAIAVALGIWLLALAGEALAQRQLLRFRGRASNHDRVCRHGLWAYSRHPDYFFKCVYWLAYVPLAWQAPWGWLTWLPPLLVALALLRGSGVPVREANLVSRKPGYAEYMRATSELIPWRRREI